MQQLVYLTLRVTILDNSILFECPGLQGFRGQESQPFEGSHAMQALI